MPSDGELGFPLEVLNGWPPGTPGRGIDNALIRRIDSLGKRYGYDRISFLCAEIETVWRQGNLFSPIPYEDLSRIPFDPDLVSHFNALCNEHGYGRVPQIVQDLADIHLRPATIESKLESYVARMKSMLENHLVHRYLEWADKNQPKEKDF